MPELPYTAVALADRLGLPRIKRRRGDATDGFYDLKPGGAPTKSERMANFNPPPPKPKRKAKAKPRLTANEQVASLPRRQPLERRAARYNNPTPTPTPTRYEGKHMSTLSEWIASGGEGMRNVGIDSSSLQLVVDSPAGAVSSRAVTLDWLKLGAEPIMSRIQTVSITASSGITYRGDSVTAGYVVPGSSNPVPDDPVFKMLKMEPKLLATVPVEVTRGFLATLPEGDAWLSAGLMDQLRRTIVREILIGSGATGHAQGIYGSTGVEVMATPGTLAALNHNKLHALRALSVSNQIEDKSGDLWVLSSTVADKLSKTALQNNTSRRLLERMPPTADGLPRSEIAGMGESYRASGLTSNVALVGDFSQVILGLWMGDMDDANSMYVVVNPYASEPNVRITAYVSFNLAILRPDRFASALFT